MNKTTHNQLLKVFIENLNYLIKTKTSLLCIIWLVVLVQLLNILNRLNFVSSYSNLNQLFLEVLTKIMSVFINSLKVCFLLLFWVELILT